MSPVSRRRFLRDTAIGISAATLLSPAHGRAAGAAERVRVAVIGCGNQGKAHFRSLTTLKDAEIVYACDIDQERLGMGVEMSGGALKRGTVYVTLGRMQEKGYLESRQEPLPEGAIGLPRRLYRPTGHALNILAAWRAAEQAFAGLAARPQET